MHEYNSSQNKKLKNVKKIKELKILTNSIPFKKSHCHSNISEYETEQSIQKNFSNKCLNRKSNSQTKSINT